MAIDKAWDGEEDDERNIRDATYRKRPQPKILCAYIGYSMHTSGPVLVNALQSRPSSEELQSHLPMNLGVRYWSYRLLYLQLKYTVDRSNIYIQLPQRTSRLANRWRREHEGAPT